MTLIRTLMPDIEKTAATEDAMQRLTPKRGAWTFFREWLKAPLETAALSPSGRQLTRAMMTELPSDARRVIELGAGTGVFTRAILHHGIAAKNLLALELNRTLFEHLRKELPNAQLYCGDARKLAMIASAAGFLADGPVDAIVSGLGLLAMGRAMQTDILQAAFSVLKHDGCFIQFTYGPKPPVAPNVLASLGLTVRRAGFALWNLPPA